MTSTPITCGDGKGKMAIEFLWQVGHSLRTLEVPVDVILIESFNTIAAARAYRKSIVFNKSFIKASVADHTIK